MRRIRRRCARRPAVRRPLDDAVPHATRPQHATQAAASSTVPPGPREAGCVGWCGRRRRSAARLRAVISQPTPATAALVAAPVARRPSPVNRAPLRPWRPSRAPAGMRRQAKTMTEASTPQQVAGSGMQLVTVCRLEGGLFGPGPGSGPGPGPGPKRVVVGCGTRRLFPARRSQPELPCPAPELDR